MQREHSCSSQKLAFVSAAKKVGLNVVYHVSCYASQHP